MVQYSDGHGFYSLSTAWCSCLVPVWDVMHSIDKIQAQIWYIGSGTVSLAAGWLSSVDTARGFIKGICAHLCNLFRLFSLSMLCLSSAAGLVT